MLPLVLAGSPPLLPDLSLTFATGRLLSNVRNRELRGLVEQGHSRFWFLPLMRFRYGFHHFLRFRIRTIALELTNRVYSKLAFCERVICKLLDSFFSGGKSIDRNYFRCCSNVNSKEGRGGRERKKVAIEINFVKAGN